MTIFTFVLSVYRVAATLLYWCPRYDIMKCIYTLCCDISAILMRCDIQLVLLQPECRI